MNYVQQSPWQDLLEPYSGFEGFSIHGYISDGPSHEMLEF